LLAGLIFAPFAVRSSSPEPPAEREAAEELPFVEVPGLSAPVVQEGKLRYFLYLNLKIVVGKQENLGLVESQVPRLRDSFILVLHRGHLVEPGQDSVDLDGLVMRLRDVANQMLGEDLVDRVVVLQARKG
jgi:hypothetical protein